MNAFESGNENMFCLIDGNRGIYIPQQFAKNWGDAVLFGASKKEIQILIEGPENQDYWDCWAYVVDNIRFTFDGIECTLFEDNDLWAVPVN